MLIRLSAMTPSPTRRQPRAGRFSRVRVSCSLFDLPFLQQPRPAVGAHVRRSQLNCCDGLQGEGSVVSAAGVQAALLADVGTAGRLRVAPCAAPC